MHEAKIGQHSIHFSFALHISFLVFDHHALQIRQGGVGNMAKVTRNLTDEFDNFGRTFGLHADFVGDSAKSGRFVAGIDRLNPGIHCQKPVADSNIVQLGQGF